MEAIVSVVPLPISARLDPIREVDANAMLNPCRRAADRTGRGLQRPGHHDARCSALDIHVKLDALEEWRMDGARHHPIDPPVGRPIVDLDSALQARSSADARRRLVFVDGPPSFLPPLI